MQSAHCPKVSYLKIGWIFFSPMPIMSFLAYLAPPKFEENPVQNGWILQYYVRFRKIRVNLNDGHPRSSYQSGNCEFPGVLPGDIINDLPRCITYHVWFVEFLFVLKITSFREDFVSGKFHFSRVLVMGTSNFLMSTTPLRGNVFIFFRFLNKRRWVR